MSLDVAANLVVCPMCEAHLVLGDRAAACPSGHSFDIARQGYLNLLRGPAPKNADTAAMVAARDRFLSTGHYEPIAAAVAARVQGSRLLEVGAGTGYYLAHALERNPAAIGIATDVSVAAAKRAARAHDRAASIVADTWAGLPLRSGCIESVLCVFAPRNMDEFRRVLAPGGTLLVVTPGPDHLAALRARFGLLDIDPDKDERLAAAAVDRFESLGRWGVSHTAAGTASQISDLVAMGPNAFHTGDLPREPMRIDIEVEVTLFRRLEQR